MTSSLERNSIETRRINVTGLFNVISTYVEWRKLAQFNGLQIAKDYGDQICRDLSRSSPNTTPVLVCARNESNDLPRLLLALSKQNNVRVIVVDNASTDGTGEIAQSLGAEVISEPTQGLSYALASGFDYLQQRRVNCDNKLLLLTDADAFPVKSWVESMKQSTQTQLSGQPGIVTALIVAAGGGIMQDTFHTTAAMGKDIYYCLRGYVNARGPNSAILLDDEGKIIDALAHNMDMEVFIGQDQIVQDTVIAAGGIARYNWYPNAVVIIRGDRYSSISDILRAFFAPNRVELYSDYPTPNGSKKEYYSQRRPKIGRY